MAVADVPRGTALNRLLRRADWRFLLPDCRPVKSICFTGGLLAQAVAHISDQVADPQGDSDGDCDLAVAVDPDGATLEAAWRALRPGGSCYSEWYSPLTGGARGLQVRLKAAGFQDAACYWPWPSPRRASPLFWIPLHAQGALNHFLSTRPRPRNPAVRVSQVLRHALGRVGLQSGFAFPVCAIAQKPALRPERPPAGSPAAGDLLRAVRTGWGDWQLGAAPGKLSLLLSTQGSRSTNKAVALVFAEPAPQPRLVLKMPRVLESVPALAREAAVLRAVHAPRPSGMPGVPRLLFFHEEHGGSCVLGETAVSGPPLFTRLQRGNFRRLALKATSWLAGLAGTPPPLSRGAWWDRLVGSVLDGFLRSFGPVVDPRSTRNAGEILERLGDLPMVCEQRDFSPWNVLVGPGDELVVLDWESAELQGLPALDLIYFLTYLAFFLENALDSGRFRESYRALRDPSTFTGGIAAECLWSYSKRLNLDPGMLRPLRLLTWMVHARSEYQRLVTDYGDPPGPEALRRSLFLSLWEEELSLDDSA